MKLLQTVDSFYFRGHNRFDAGSEGGGTSLFPPRPNTVYGALRTAWIERNGSLEGFLEGRYASEIGTPTSHGALTIDGLVLWKEGELYVPLPHDHQVVQEDGVWMAHPLRLGRSDGYESDGASYRLYGPLDRKSASPVDKWVRVRDLGELLGKRNPVQVFASSEFIAHEPKIGIALDRESRTAMESMLYQIERLRLQDGVALALDVQGGGELTHVSLGRGRTKWIVTEVEGELPKKVDGDDSPLLRVTWLTPAIIERPLVEDGRFRFLDAPWVQTAMHRTALSGGWDMVRNRPKTRKTMIPAGTSVIIDRRQLGDGTYPLMMTDEGSEEGYGRVMYSVGPTFGEETR